MLVYNPTSQKHTVRVFGNHFEFTAGQVKSMSDNIGTFLVTEKAYMGFVHLPDVCAESPTSKEAIEAKEAAKGRGINRRIEFLKRVMHNEEVSLRQDLDKNNNKASTDSFLNKAIVEQYKELAAYQAAANDDVLKMADEAKKAKEAISKSN